MKTINYTALAVFAALVASTLVVIMFATKKLVRKDTSATARV